MNWRLISDFLQIEWIVLGLLLPLLLLLPLGTMQPLLLLALPGLWLVRRWQGRPFLPQTPLNTAVLLLLLMVLVSLFVSPNPAISFVKVAGLLLGITLFFMAVSYLDEVDGRLWRLLLVYLLLSGAIILYLLTAVTWLPPLDWLNQLNRVLALPVMNPNEAAGVLLWIVPFLWALTLYQKQLPGAENGRWRWLPWATGLTLLLLVGTQSRAGLASLLGGLLLLLLLHFRRRRLLLLAGAATLALLLAVWAGSLTGAGGGLGLNGRLEIWSRALLSLADFPLTGMGMNNFRYLVARFYPLSLVAPQVDIGHAHNHLLQAGLDLGLPGMVAYLALWLLCAGLLWRCWQRPLTSAQRALVLGLIGSFSAAWLFGLVDAIALGARPTVLWWLLLALVVGAWRETAVTI